MHISPIPGFGRNLQSSPLHVKVYAYNNVFLLCVCVRVCACVCKGLGDGGEKEEEQEASRAVRSRHGGNIWQQLT